MAKEPEYTKHSNPSGNEGRKHPGMKHAGYFAPRPEYVNEQRLAVQRAWFKNHGKD